MKAGHIFTSRNQFQVFIDGKGSVGKTPLNPISVHYASAFSPYGPLRGSEKGLTYFTLRNGYDPGIHYMEHAREELKRAHRRPRVEQVNAVPVATANERMAASAPQCGALIGPHEDGLAAWRYVLPPGSQVRGPEPAAGGGQYWLALSGSGDVSSESMSSLSCLFCSPDESARRVTAGPDGVTLLVLQFPEALP
jgi:hypothetical protein